MFKEIPFRLRICLVLDRRRLLQTPNREIRRRPWPVVRVRDITTSHGGTGNNFDRTFSASRCACTVFISLTCFETKREHSASTAHNAIFEPNPIPFDNEALLGITPAPAAPQFVCSLVVPSLAPKLAPFLMLATAHVRRPCPDQPQ